MTIGSEAPAAFGGRTAKDAVRWSALAVVTKQALQMVCALVLARLLGPSSYGIISAATIYVTLTTLILDQGLASALIQRPDLSRYAPGAVATANVVSGALLAAVTWFVAPLIADFFGIAGLTGLLRVLGFGLFLKAVAIAPRAMLMRNVNLRPVAMADIAGGTVGAATGIAAALLGADYRAMIWQVVATDLVIALVLLAASRGTAPNLRWRELGAILPFGLRIFAMNGIAFFSRNADNILVGRFLGVTSLSYYSMAYRVLVIPVQMIGQTVNRVLFPALSRLASDRSQVAATFVKATELLAMVTVPLMAFVAVSSHQVVAVVLGPDWAPTASLLSVLAVAGARETVFYITGSLMRAMGEAKLNLRYEVLATTVQLSGIVVGLSYGLIGVALGYTIAGFLLAPVMLVIQRRLTGVLVRSQVWTITPAVHASLWGASAYALIRLTDWSSLVTLVVGAAAYLGTVFLVLWLVHRPALRRTIDAGLGIVGAR